MDKTKDKQTQNNTVTFHDHLIELRRRFLYVAVVLIIGAILGFMVHEPIQDILVSPLGQPLHYTSPMGGLQFIFKISLFAGILLSIPAFIYNLIKFVEPSITKESANYSLKIVATSFLLLVTGISFGYFVSLPAVLTFLIGFAPESITPIITTDEYLSFVTLYLMAFGLIFQIPLIFLIINNFTPLNPQKLMKSQKYVVILSYIAAAIISPTIDIINQTIMALPIIVLYELSIGLVWMVNRYSKYDWGAVLVEDENGNIISSEPEEGFLSLVGQTLRPHKLDKSS
ncbi:MAG: twin-arginine translocase subunit TatC [Candidatus Saccharimonadales bacterium]